MNRSTSKPCRLAPLLAAGAAAACFGTPNLRIDGAEARLSPSVVGVCSIFLTIANAGNRADALLEAQVDVPGAITRIHAVEDGRMIESDRIVVPASGVVALRPGGLHIMAFNLPAGIGPGTVFTLRLRFERSGERRTSVRIAEGASGT